MKGLLLALLTFFVFVSAQNQLPGFKLTITQKGLTKINEVAEKVLINELTDFVIEEQEGDIDTPIGRIDYKIEKLTIEEIKVKTHSQIIPQRHIEIKASDLMVNLKFKWSFKRRSWPRVGDDGTGIVTTKESKIDLNAVIESNDGKPLLNATKLETDLQKLEIKLKGGASWLYNIFINVFKSRVKNVIEDTINSVALEIINDKINSIIDKIPFLVKLPGDIGFDLRMSSKPSYTKEFLTVPLKTEFFDWSNRKPSRFKPIEMPNVIQNDKMIHAMISNFPGLTIGDIIQQKGMINTWITDDMIPPPSPFRLNTRSFKDVFPNFDKVYPDSEIKIHLHSPTAPSFIFQKSGFIGQIPVETKWYAIDSETGDSKLGFTLNGRVGVKGIAGLSRMNVTAKIEDVIFEFKETQSTIGPVEWEKIQAIADLFIERAFKNFINDFLSTTGIPLPPVPGLQILNPFFKYEDGFAGLAIDGEYIVTMTNEKISNKKSYCIDCRQSIQIIERNMEKSKEQLQIYLKNICNKYEGWMKTDCLKIIGQKIEQKMNLLKTKKKTSPVIICNRIEACKSKE